MVVRQLPRCSCVRAGGLQVADASPRLSVESARPLSWKRGGRPFAVLSEMDVENWVER